MYGFPIFQYNQWIYDMHLLWNFIINVVKQIIFFYCCALSCIHKNHSIHGTKNTEQYEIVSGLVNCLFEYCFTSNLLYDHISTRYFIYIYIYIYIYKHIYTYIYNLCIYFILRVELNTKCLDVLGVSAIECIMCSWLTKVGHHSTSSNLKAPALLIPLWG